MSNLAPKAVRGLSWACGYDASYVLFGGLQAPVDLGAGAGLIDLDFGWKLSIGALELTGQRTPPGGAQRMQACPQASPAPPWELRDQEPRLQKRQPQCQRLPAVTLFSRSLQWGCGELRSFELQKGLSAEEFISAQGPYCAEGPAMKRKSCANCDFKDFGHLH